MPRLLVIAPTFPPRNASQAMRGVHYTKYLAQLGWEIEVYTLPRQASLLFTEEDDYLQGKIPPGVTVHTPPSPLFALLGLLRVKRQRFRQGASFVRSYTSRLAFPDARVDWALPALAHAVARSLRGRPDAVLSLAYPFTAHLVGYALKQLWGVRWVADYGDPWTCNPSVDHPPWMTRAIRALEGRWMTACDGLSVTTEGFAEAYREVYPQVEGKLIVTPNGYDHEDFEGIAPVRFDGFSMLHAGNLDSPARDPRPFLDALERLPDEVASRARLVLVGVLGEQYRAQAEALVQARRLVLEGWVSAQDSYRYMAGADTLLLFGNRGTMQIPGKLYSYLGARKPVMVLQQAQGDPSVQIVQKHNRGPVVPNEAEAIGEAISEAVALHEAGQTAKRYNLEPLHQYSWEEAVRGLHRLLGG